MDFVQAAAKIRWDPRQHGNMTQQTLIRATMLSCNQGRDSLHYREYATILCYRISIFQ